MRPVTPSLKVQDTGPGKGPSSAASETHGASPQSEDDVKYVKYMKSPHFLVILLLILPLTTKAQERKASPPKQTIGVTTSTAAGPLTPAKAAWQFTEDERIALRTNPALARERLSERHLGAPSKIRPTSADGQRWADSFNGRTHPELFLPHEVFSEFVNLAFGGDPRTRDIVRHGMVADIRKAGLPADFWERLEATIAFHLADVRAERDLLASRSKTSGSARERAEKSLELKRADVCRSRADALAAARNAFGRERFDRFLYEAVAINMFYSSDRLPTTTDLRRWEGGCR